MVPERWRFNFDNERISLRDLSWQQAVEVLGAAEAGDLSAQADGECVSLEFSTTHAAVLYMGRDHVILRPYLQHRPAADQDLGPFFCGECGIQLGDKDDCLSRFVSREDGFRLFAAVLASSPSLPSGLPDPNAGQPVLSGFEAAAEESTAGRALEWRPLQNSQMQPNLTDPSNP